MVLITQNMTEKQYSISIYSRTYIIKLFIRLYSYNIKYSMIHVQKPGWVRVNLLQCGTWLSL